MNFRVSLIVILALENFGLCSQYVNLTSLHKQPYFCPHEEEATFLCVAAGTDLVWVVNGRMLSYNSIASLGSARSILGSSVESVLVKIWGSTGNGFAYRRSILTLKVQSSAVNLTTIRCHNGTDSVVKEELFLQNYRVPNLTVTLSNIDYDINLKVWNMSWDSEGRDVIDFYILQINSHQPFFLKNNSAQIMTPDSSNNHILTLKAIDECANKGPSVAIEFPQQYLLMSKTVTSDISAGIRNDASILTILLMAIAVLSFNFVGVLDTMTFSRHRRSVATASGHLLL